LGYYQYIYINPEENGSDLFNGIKRFIEDYNYHRTHQGIERQIPAKLYFSQKIPA
jgi:putative transposase